jgi:hypothetical protein
MRRSARCRVEAGTYIGPRTLVEIVDVRLQIERIGLDTLIWRL